MSIFSICADPYSSGAHRSHGRNNPSIMETTMKVVGTAGAFFFTLGAMVLDPLLLIPAALFAAIATSSFLDCDLLSLFSSVYIPSPSSGRPRNVYTHVPATTPVYYGQTTSYSAQAIPSYPAHYSAAPSPSVTIHTARGGGNIATVDPQVNYTPPPPLNLTPHVARGGGTVLTQQPYPTASYSGTFGDPSPTPTYNQQLHQQQQSIRGVAPPPVIHTGRGGSSVPVTPTDSRMPQPLPTASNTGVAPPPTLHVRRGGGNNDYVTGNNG